MTQPKVTVADIFGTMESRVNPSGIQGVSANYGYQVTGEGGGQWTVCVHDDAVKVVEGLKAPDVLSTIEAQDFIDLTLGKLDGMTAFSSGKLAVEGDLGLMLKATRFFKKYSPPGAEAREAPSEELLVLKQLLSLDQRFSTGPLMGRFLSELRDHTRILANQCPVCGRKQVPPREMCAECHVPCQDLVEVGPGGVLCSWDVAFYASPDPLTGQSRETPYCSAFVLLDGCQGNDVFWHEINPSDIPRLKVGARVRPVWAERRTGEITDIRWFELVEAAGEAPQATAPVAAARPVAGGVGPQHAFVIPGKLALPYQYFAGRVGSRFLTALRDQQVVWGTRCARCDQVFVPPRRTCEKHPGESCDQWVALPGTGTLAGFTVIRYAEPYQPCPPPYVLALISLDGSASRIAHVLKGVEPEQARLGLRLKPVFAREARGTILQVDHFEPA
jgi:uncharacterized OB-fold protein/putative sterol carrier protein